MNRRRR